jgi:hypothetical protein
MLRKIELLGYTTRNSSKVYYSDYWTHPWWRCPIGYLPSHTSEKWVPPWFWILHFYFLGMEMPDQSFLHKVILILTAPFQSIIVGFLHALGFFVFVQSELTHLRNLCKFGMILTQFSLMNYITNASTHQGVIVGW